MKPVRRLFFVLCLVLGLTTSVDAQILPTPCFGDDGFNVVCCQPVFPILPAFPSFTSNGLWACIRDCALESQLNITVALAAPVMITCDYYLIPVSVSSPALIGPSFTTTLIAKYSRTWIELDMLSGTQRQVWRFLLNADANFPAAGLAGAAPCPIPPCATSFGGNVHLIGHIDYAMDCPTSPIILPNWRIAMNLNHVTGCVTHAPFSARPLGAVAALHPDRSYVLVAPANFVFAPVMEPMGPVIAEATRSSLFNPATGAYQCFGETDIMQGNLSTNFSNCFTCAMPPVLGAPPIWRHQGLGAVATCNGAAFPISSIPFPPVFPTGLMCMNVGNWTPTAAGTFPGQRSLHIYYGVLQYQDPCNPAAFPFHAISGVGTVMQASGFLFGTGPIGVVHREFVDLENMLLLNAGLSPGLGDVFYSSIVWNLNSL